MVRNKKTHGKKRLDSPSTINIPSTITAPSTITTQSTVTNSSTITNLSTNDVGSAKSADAVTSDHTTTPYLPDANAARTVFKTVELLEMVLVHLPTKTLSRALSVSKHCRDVILGNQQLRQKLFLEPVLPTEYLERGKWVQVAVPGILGTTRVRHEVISKERLPRSWDSRIIVEAHPILEVASGFEDRMYKASLYSGGLAWHTNDNLPTDAPFMQTMSMSCEVVKKLPAQTLLFQPPVTQVKMYHHNSPILLRCSKGVTLGAVAEQLEKVKEAYDQRFRAQDERIIQGFLGLPHTAVSCQERVGAIEALRRLHFAPCAAECLSFDAESAISKDSEKVREARMRMD